MGSNGKLPLIPKDEGISVMISAFVLRELGYGFEMIAEELAKVNEFRLGKEYSDKQAAKSKLGSEKKNNTHQFAICYTL